MAAHKSRATIPFGGAQKESVIDELSDSPPSSFKILTYKTAFTGSESKFLLANE